MTPEASAAIAAASDVVGYGPYVERLALAAGPARPSRATIGSKWTAPGSRLKLAAEGRAVAVVSGGDPGVFAMAAAVFEAVEEDPRMAQARHSRSRPASPRCRRPRPGSARRSATTSAPSRSPTI